MFAKYQNFGEGLGCMFILSATELPNLMLAVDNQQLNLTGDIVEEPHRIERGSLRVPNGAGLGIQMYQQKLEQCRAEQIGQPSLAVDRPYWFPTKPQY